MKLRVERMRLIDRMFDNLDNYDDMIDLLLAEAYRILLRSRVTHLRRVFRAAVNMIIVHRRYINDFYKPGSKGANISANRFRSNALLCEK